MDRELPSPYLAYPHGAILNQNTKRRVRHKINTLVYVRLDQGNGGIIHDLSEFGVAVQAVAALRVHQHVRVRFDLPNSRIRVEAIGYVAWANNAGRAGIQFTQIGQRTRQQLKDWLLMNLLATASYLSQASGIFATPRPDDCGQLVFSAAPHSAIPLLSGDRSQNSRVKAAISEKAELSERPLEFSWCPIPIGARTLANGIDAVVVLICLLLFCSIFLAITHQIPPWPMAVAISVGMVILFSLLYRFLFVCRGPGSLGYRLAIMAGPKSEAENLSRQESTRFR